MSESDLTVLVVKGASGRPSEDAVPEGNFAEVDRSTGKGFPNQVVCAGTAQA